MRKLQIGDIVFWDGMTWVVTGYRGGRSFMVGCASITIKTEGGIHEVHIYRRAVKKWIPISRIFRRVTNMGYAVQEMW